jgi:DNA (cytosine-5)-methyltransferase 1
MDKGPQLIDFFCGAGGFSEGFRQQGFQVMMGVDKWPVAIKTHNLNHDLSDTPKDVLDFASSTEEIDKLPDTEVIVGSPPCVLFSLSNNGGKADKTLGVKLIEAFLRVVAVKKHKRSSKLVAWFMENVPNSRNYIKPVYTFRDLNLESWAKEQKIDPDAIALSGSQNGRILNTADFGVSQKRERFVCGEIVSNGAFPDLSSHMAKEHRSIGAIKGKMPPPNLASSEKIFVDPNYASLKVHCSQITDHFYDSGIYECQWRAARAAKTNHPYMGQMSFPENESKPSRTIMAVRSQCTREALIYKSEYNRKGHGEYRLPTVREIATLMGFPYVYQFAGAEGNKWRQIGNAICPPLSAALAKSVRVSMGIKIIPDSEVLFSSPKMQIPEMMNLNTFEERKFKNPPKRKLTARFRKHPFKDGNMTVALTNFNPAVSTKPNGRIRWYSAVFLGTGKDFKVKTIRKRSFKRLAKLIRKNNDSRGSEFISQFEQRFQAAIGKVDKFQAAYVGEDSSDHYEPARLIEEIGKLIQHYQPAEKYLLLPDLVPGKTRIPSRQLLAMYAINRLIS